MKTKKNIAFHTLGCKLNFSETSTLSRNLNKEKFDQVDFESNADIFVLNTCSVTQNADKECRQIIRKIKRRNPNATMVVTGCFAQLQPELISNIEGVDLVLGAQEKFNLETHLASFEKFHEKKIYSCDVDDIHGFNSSYSINDRTRTFLKVQDGCDYNCSFCTIPMARGHSRSDTIEGVLANVEELSKNDVKEIVLTGVNLGDFGKGFDGAKKTSETFFDLIKALDAQKLIPRFRISSIEPNLLSSEIIDFVSSSNCFMPHFHIPLQSGSDAILGKMRRRYLTDLYSDRILQIKKTMPHACIGVDVIVGFPGETEELFEETFRFLHQLPISYLHVFTYSERPNTLAETMDEKVSFEKKQERNQKLRMLSIKKMNFFEEEHKGTIRPVLFEHEEKNGQMLGYTDNYIRISAPYDLTKVNKIENINY